MGVSLAPGDLTPFQYLQTFMTSFVGLADGFSDPMDFVVEDVKELERFNTTQVINVCRWFSSLIQSWGAQGYTDATAIVIARSCGSPLWRWMGLLGSTVVCLQCDLESRSPEVCWNLLCQAFTFCCCGRICTVTTWSLWRRFVCFEVDLCFWSCWLPVAGDGWSKLDLWSLRSLLLQDPQFKSFQPATVAYRKSGTLPTDGLAIHMQ